MEEEARGQSGSSRGTQEDSKWQTQQGLQVLCTMAGSLWGWTSSPQTRPSLAALCPGSFERPSRNFRGPAPSPPLVLIARPWG